VKATKIPFDDRNKEESKMLRKMRAAYDWDFDESSSLLTSEGSFSPTEEYCCSSQSTQVMDFAYTNLHGSSDSD
jgi:hypothetical protein